MPDLITQISCHLHTVASIQRLAQGTHVLPLIHAVQAWQTLRMQATHNAQHNNPNCASALNFFAEQIYGPQDFTQRDTDIARVVPKIHKYLPQKALSSLAAALHLHALSYELDYALASKLTEQTHLACIILDQQSYAKAYVACNNIDLRLEQINLLRTLGRNLHQAASIKGIAMMLTLSKHPARAKGLHTLHQFLQNGYNAFKKIPNSETFIQDIVLKEEQLVTLLFAPQGDNPLPYVPSIEITPET